MQAFFDEELTMHENQEMAFNEFYRSYSRYCLETGNRAFARNKIRGVVRQLDLPLVVETHSDNTRWFKALANINWDGSASIF